MENSNIDPMLAVDCQSEDEALLTELESKLDQVLSNTKFADVLEKNKLKSSLHLHFKLPEFEKDEALPLLRGALMGGCYVQQPNGRFKWTNPCPP
jgi:hypothetical protein